jgi:hypothetical protein
MSNNTKLVNAYATPADTTRTLIYTPDILADSTVIHAGTLSNIDDLNKQPHMVTLEVEVSSGVFKKIGNEIIVEYGISVAVPKINLGFGQTLWATLSQGNTVDIFLNVLQILNDASGDTPDDTVLEQLITHENNVANPHAVTATQVGLGNVNNTSDANKPVSSAQLTALNAKANLLTTTSASGSISLVNVNTGQLKSLVAGTNVTITDTSGVLTIAATGGGGGSGTVTSVALALPSIFTVSGSPVTTTGTLTAVLANQAANLILAGPTSGTATPTFRALDISDIPLWGQPNGIAQLDGGGGLVQRLKLASNGDAAFIRDNEDSGSGKNSFFCASFDYTSAVVYALLTTQIYTATQSWSARIVGMSVTGAGLIDITVYRVMNGSTPTYGHINNGTIPVVCTHGTVTASGYYAVGIAINSTAGANFGVSNFLVTEVMLNNSAGDGQLQGWDIQHAANLSALSSTADMPLVKGARKSFVTAFQLAKPTASQIITSRIPGGIWSIPVGITEGTASSDVAATASTTFNITKVTATGTSTTIGTIVFAAAGKSGTVSITTAAVGAATDKIRIIAPATADSTLASIDFCVPFFGG